MGPWNEKDIKSEVQRCKDEEDEQTKRRGNLAPHRLHDTLLIGVVGGRESLSIITSHTLSLPIRGW